LAVTHPDISYAVHILVSLFLLPLTSTIVIFFVSCGTYGGPLLVIIYSFHALFFTSKHTLMLLRLATLLTVTLFLPIVFFLVVISLLGRLRSRLWFLVRVQRLSYEVWLLRQ
jgi:hypothetical protein